MPQPTDASHLCLIPEARRRKWLEDYPEATSTDEAVVFDTSIIPWWAWMKRFHLPEAEKLNGYHQAPFFLSLTAGANDILCPGIVHSEPILLV
jgi:hypothetical protein